MEQFKSVDIVKKDCKGIYLLCDTDKQKITTSKEADTLIGNVFKLQLKTRVDGKLWKKTYAFEKRKKTFLKALEEVASKRSDLREKVKKDGTTRDVKNQDANPNEKRVTFLEKANLFLETKSISARKSTIQNYSTALLNHCKDLHDKEFSKITITDIQKIINKMLKTRAEATVVLFARTVKVFLKELNLQWEDLELPEVDNEVEYNLSLQDTKKIIKVMREYSRIEVEGEVFYQFEEIKNIFAFSLTGRRIGEILSLRFSDFNLDDNTFTIRQALSKGKKKLTFNLDNYLIEALESQKRLRQKEYEGDSDARVFSYTRETPRIHFQNLLKALGLPRLRLHDIRHMLASTLVQNGVPIQDISVMLGHSSIEITERRYASKSKDQATKATSAFNSIVGE